MQFIELCPIWSKIFAKWDKLKTEERMAIDHDMHLNTRCIVTEAWGWNDDYARPELPSYCPECHWYSHAFIFVINGDKYTLDRQLLENKIKEFAIHFYTVHSIDRNDGTDIRKTTANRISAGNITTG